ncbi:hypothetical protein AFB00_07105 [Pseudonocardia sp. HH130630-07]|nr:hypothetical protein AFB00_07105 [Pseudonocardia sp. HH130630-07]
MSVWVVAVLVLAGCGGAVQEPPPSLLGPRPVDLDLSSVDWCATLTPEQQRARGVDYAEPWAGNVGVSRSSGCFWQTVARTKFAAQVIDGRAESAAEERGLRVVSVGGFGAVRAASTTGNGPGLPPFCQIAIDVNETQTVRVQHRAGSIDDGGDPVAIEEACLTATRFGEDVLGNLRR